MESKRYYIGLIIAVLSLGMLLTGGTYAWLVFNDDTTVAGNELNAETTCFIVDYSGAFGFLFGDVNLDNKIDDLDYTILAQYLVKMVEFSSEQMNRADLNRDGVVNGLDLSLIKDLVASWEEFEYASGYTLFPSNTDRGGLVGTVIMNISEECNVSAVGNIKLNIGSATSSKYFSNGVLKYSLYASDHTTLLGSGNISSYGDKTLNTNPITLNKFPTEYYVYVWLDGSKVDNSYLNLPFSGYLHANATQIED